MLIFPCHLLLLLSVLYIGIKQTINNRHEKTTPIIKTAKCNIKISIKNNPLLNVKIDTNNNTGKKQQGKDSLHSGNTEHLPLTNQKLLVVFLRSIERSKNLYDNYSDKHL